MNEFKVGDQIKAYDSSLCSAYIIGTILSDPNNRSFLFSDSVNYYLVECTFDSRRAHHYSRDILYQQGCYKNNIEGLHNREGFQVKVPLQIPNDFKHRITFHGDGKHFQQLPPEYSPEYSMSDPTLKPIEIIIDGNSYSVEEARHIYWNLYDIFGDGQ